MKVQIHKGQYSSSTSTGNEAMVLVNSPRLEDDLCAFQPRVGEGPPLHSKLQGPDRSVEVQCMCNDCYWKTSHRQQNVWNWYSVQRRILSRHLYYTPTYI